MMEASTSSKSPDDEEHLELEDVWSDLHALKKLYGVVLLQKTIANTTHSGSDDSVVLDDKTKVFLMKLLDEATRRTLQRQAKMVSGTPLSPPPSVRKSDQSCDPVVKEIGSPGYYLQRCHQPQKESSSSSIGRATSGKLKEEPMLPSESEQKIDDGNPNRPSSSERVDLKRLKSHNSTRSHRDEKAQMTPKQYGSAHHHRPVSIDRPSKLTGKRAGELPSAAEAKVDSTPRPSRERVDLKRLASRKNSIKSRSEKPKTTISEYGLSSSHHPRPIHRAVAIDQGSTRIPPDLRQRGEQPRRSPPTKHRIVAAAGGYHSGETAHKRSRVEATDRSSRAPVQPVSTQVKGHDGSSKSVRLSRDVMHHLPRRIGSQRNVRSIKNDCRDRTAENRQTNKKEMVRLPSRPAKPSNCNRIPSRRQLLGGRSSTTRSSASTSLRTTSTTVSSYSSPRQLRISSARRRSFRNRRVVVPHGTRQTKGEIVLHRASPSRPIRTRRKSPAKPVAPPRRKQKQSDHREGRLKRLKNKLGIIFHHHHYHHHHHHGGRVESTDSSTGESGFHQEQRSPWKYLRSILHRKSRGKLVMRKVEGERAGNQRQRGYLHALLEALLRHFWGTRGRKGAGLRRTGKLQQQQHWWQRLRRRGGVRLINCKKPRLMLGFGKAHSRPHQREFKKIQIG